MQNLIGKQRNLIDTLPPLSLYKGMAAAQLMETLGLLTTNGVSLQDALCILRRSAHPYLSWHLLKMEYRLKLATKNEKQNIAPNIAEILDTNLIKSTDLIKLRIALRCKHSEQALIELGRKAYRRNVKLITATGKIMGKIVWASSTALTAALIVGIFSVSGFGLT